MADREIEIKELELRMQLLQDDAGLVPESKKQLDARYVSI